MGKLLDIVTVNFNTPEYIIPLVSSLHKSNAWVTDNVLVFDNSNTEKMPQGIFDGYSVSHIPNEIYSDINKLPPSKFPAAGSYNSARHAKTIQHILATIHSDYCLLVDSDIVFTVNFQELFNLFVNSNSFMCGYERVTYTHHTIAPWCCLINMKLYRHFNMNFYDANRILYVNDLVDYDTGASLYEDALKLGLKIIKTPDNLYWIHFKGGSVFKSAGIQWLQKNKFLWI